MAVALGIAILMAASKHQPDRPQLLRRVELIPVLVDRSEGLVEDEDLVEIARSGQGKSRRMAVELLGCRGLAETVWGYADRLGSRPSEWWTYDSALAEGREVSEELGWSHLWLIEARATRQGDVFLTGTRERVQ